MSEPDDDGAWADDGIPVPDPPAEDALGDHIAVASSAPNVVVGEDDAPVFGPLAAHTPSSNDHTSTFWSRRKRVVAAVAAGCAALAAVMVLSGGDEQTPTDTSSDSSQDTSTDTSTSEVPDTIERPTTTTLPRPEPATAARPISIELPPEVSSISEPTEVLMLGMNGVLHTLSLPSGVMRSVHVDVDSGDLFQGLGLVVAPDAAALVIGPRMVIAPRDGPSIVEIEGEEFSGSGFDVVGWEPADDGSTRFLAASYSNDGTSTSYEVGLDGSVGRDDGPNGIGRSYSTLQSPDGRAYVNDAGGVYEVSTDGSARRIDDGTLRAASVSSLLIRQCTPELVCGDVLVDRATGERRPIAEDVLPAALQYDGFGLDLAPDGSAVTAIRPSDVGQDRVVIDLVTGEQVSVSSQSWSRGSLWAADSSGVFELSTNGEGIEFLDRASGQVVHFADELGPIASVAIRTPEAELAPQAVVSTVPITYSDGAEPSSAGLVVTALSYGGNVVEIDLDGRTADIWTASGAIAVRRASMFVFAGQVAVVTSDNPKGEPAGFVAALGQERPLPPELFGPGPLLAGPTPSTVWSTMPAGSSIGSVGVEMVLVDLDAGAPVVPPQVIAVPRATLLGGDGRGGIVVQRGGDVYVATADGESTDLVRLTSGELLAIGADTAYVRECDDSSTCSVQRVDRATGQRSPVSAAAGLDGAFGIDTDDPPIGLMGTAVSPGGDVMVVRMPMTRSDDSDPAPWVALDVSNGSSIVLEKLNGSAPFVWNAEATVAATLIGGQLIVIDRASGGAWAIDGLGMLRGLAGGPVGAD